MNKIRWSILTCIFTILTISKGYTHDLNSLSIIIPEKITHIDDENDTKFTVNLKNNTDADIAIEVIFGRDIKFEIISPDNIEVGKRLGFKRKLTLNIPANCNKDITIRLAQLFNTKLPSGKYSARLVLCTESTGKIVSNLSTLTVDSNK